MRILNLDLIAFGPFANQSLDLSEGGLHLVYGPNEAGKSSTLRALRQVLYGIDMQTQDDFRFPYKKLKLGATLEHHEGDVLSFIRLKKIKNPLRTIDGEEPLSEDCLDRFLENVDQGMFERQFGLNWEKLVKGGQEMVASEGELSRILFAAGSGLTVLSRVQDNIENEMKKLFLPTGSNPVLNVLIDRHKTAEDKLRQTRLSSQEWQQHAETVEAARQKQAELNARKNDLNREHNRLGRIQRAKRSIQKLRQAERELTELQQAKELPSDFPERRLNVQNQLLKSQQAQETLQANLERQAGQKQRIAVNQTVLDQAAEIESLNQEIGSYDKSIQDYPKINSEREAAENEARRLLKELRPKYPWEMVEELRISEADRTLIVELGSDQKALATEVESAQSRWQESQQQLDDLLMQQKNQTEVPDLSALKLAHKRATARGSLEAERAEKWRGICDAQKAAQQECAQLPFWSGTLEELEAIRVPLRETLNRFQTQFDEAQRRLTEVIQQRDQGRKALRENTEALEQLESEGEVPTDNDLREARERRDQGWQLLQQCWRSGESSPPNLTKFLKWFETSDLGEAFEKAIHQADALADRLRQETSRVNEKKRLLSIRKQLEAGRPEREQQIATCQKDLEQVQQEWQNEWQLLGITPGTPGEMQEWRQKHLEVMLPVKPLESQRDYVKLLDKSIKELRELLIGALEPLGRSQDLLEKTLGELIEESELVLDEITVRQNQQARLEEEVERTQRNLKRCQQQVHTVEEKRKAWEKRWATMMEKIGLSAEATPHQSNVILDTLKRLFDEIREESDKAIRVRQMREFNTQFEDRVNTLVQVLGWNANELPPIQIVTNLHAELTRTREAAHKLQDVQEEIERQEHELASHEQIIQQSEVQLQQMCAQAGCDHPSELAQAEKDSARRQELLKAHKELREQIVMDAADANFEDFLKEADTEDTDTLSGKLADLERQSKEVETALTAQIRLAEREQNQLDHKCGGSQAAEAAEEKQSLLAEMQLHLDRYVQLRLAAEALKEGAERYRAKHQGPVLKRASELFRGLTGGAFLRLQNDGDDQGKPRLVGIRQHEGSEESVEVTGMSDGTADQLYLALRMASLEDWLDHHPPMPFIVDDILINFDDRRAVAALQVLAELSKRTQVIFFTHHQHLIDLADAHLSKGQWVFHHLGKGTPRRKKKPQPATSKESERATLF